MDYQGVEELLAIYCEANKEKIYKQNPEDIKQGMREYLREKLMSNCTSEDAQKNKDYSLQIPEHVVKRWCRYMNGLKTFIKT